MKSMVIDPADNVEIRLEGELAGHKFARRAIHAGENVIKYGMPIGHATAEIAPGEHVHTHNMATNLSGVAEYSWDSPHFEQKPVPPGEPPYTFMGYRRANGHTGVRNHLFVVPTVGCVNNLVRRLAEAINRELPPGVDPALPLEHPYGCSQLGDDHECTKRILAGLVKHPNAGGVLVVGLGCENNTIAGFRQALGEFDSSRIRFLVAQEENDEFSAGMAILRELAEQASHDKRVETPVSALRVGLKCGGSDGFSGLTANVLIGHFSDWLTARGGTAVMSEVPEMFGAETLLMERCIDRHVFDECVSMINDFKRYFMRFNQPVCENPSPGNKAGGITTLEDKSLGCTQKSGHGPVVDVLETGCHPVRHGLNLLTGPGNDMVASTLLAAAGVQMILFSTGRGTPFGTVVPTLKIASNSSLAARKPHWIDFNAGVMLDGVDADPGFRDLILRTASGQLAANEKNSDQEISIFKDGVTL